MYPSQRPLFHGIDIIRSILYYIVRMPWLQYIGYAMVLVCGPPVTSPGKIKHLSHGQRGKALGFKFMTTTAALR